MSAIQLPSTLRRRLDAALHSLLYGLSEDQSDFDRPLREEALISAHSVSWRVFKNPVALFVGGTAAVILELADPSVCAGIWEYSSFRKNPLGRLQRTGLAAMITVYSARSIAEPMIARIVRMHAGIQGRTPAGASYSASDPRLLTWVHATAAFGFGAAYSRYVRPLGEGELNRLYVEGIPVSQLYGATDPPNSVAAMRSLFESAAVHIAPSPVIFEFLRIMRETMAFPRPLHWMQPILVRAAVELIPDWIRARLGLSAGYGLNPYERWLTKLIGASSDRIVLPASPAVQSCLRLGLPMTYLYG
ncbi:MAG TPA: oxygenase MpaB family protein [Steroidobacteraceae bacterium]|nr:oxygenase MpaB family protein [Steroidobacteraceae bacterium]